MFFIVLADKKDKKAEEKESQNDEEDEEDEDDKEMATRATTRLASRLEAERSLKLKEQYELCCFSFTVS